MKLRHFFCQSLFILFLSFSSVFEGQSYSEQFSQELLSYKEQVSILEYGRTVTAASLQSAVQLLSPVLQKNIQSIADEISQAAGTQVFRIHLVNSSLVNAFAIPSGDIFLHSGLLDRLESRDELAFVLGHEAAHINLQHSLEKVRHNIDVERTRIFVATLFVNLVTAAAGGAVGNALILVGPYYVGQELTRFSEMIGQLIGRVPEVIVNYMALLNVRGYSRIKELEADQLGILYMEKAGYDPEAAISALEKLSDKWHIREGTE